MRLLSIFVVVFAFVNGTPSSLAYPNLDAVSPSGEVKPVVVPKHAAEKVMRPLIEAARLCMANAATADPAFSSENVPKLLVNISIKCASAHTKMVNTHDELYGPGSGKAFFLGPYLDALPDFVREYARQKGAAGL